MVFDAVAGVLLLLAVVAGWRGGLIGRLGAWIGFAVGGLATARWIGSAVELVNINGQNQRLAVAAAAVLLGALLGHGVGRRLARGLRGLVPRPFRWIDSIIGVFVGVGFVGLFIWILLPPLAAAKGWPERQSEQSKIVEFVERYTPITPSATGLLGELLANWSSISTFRPEEGPLDVGLPPEEISVSAEVLERAAGSVVRVQATACSQQQNGTAFVIAPGFVLTNAHVVAGAKKIEIALPGEGLKPATVTAFDPERDLALIRIEVEIPPLSLQTPLEGQLAVVIGHPLGGPLRTAPIRLVERVIANGEDIHRSLETKRKIWFSAANLKSGDSGAPVIDTNGDVLGVVFAVAPPTAVDYERAAYVLDRSEVAAFMAEVAALTERSVVNTGKCLK
ncbi:MAG: CvpA family protein [Candidatus Poriferisodalaceae bacterium]|nr:MAG: hypothetical protein CNE88_03550 [Acidimicrobiales bacterium MED-G01]